MELFGRNILVKKIIEYKSEIERTFAQAHEEYQLPTSEQGEVIQLGIDCRLNLNIGDRIIFRPFDQVELKDREGEVLICEDRVIAKL